MKLRHPVCLEIRTSEISRARSIVRDFRSSSSTIMAGLPLWTVHGLNGVRSLQEMGRASDMQTVEVLADTRLSGNSDEIYETAVELLVHGELRGLTISAMVGREAMDAAMQAAADSMQRTFKRERPLVIAWALPDRFDFAAWQRQHGGRVKRETYIARLAAEAATCGLDGFVTDWAALESVRATSPALPLLAPARCPAADPDRAEPDKAHLHSPGAALAAGADVVLYDVVNVLGHTDLEWASDKLQSEIAPYLPLEEKDAEIQEED